MKTLSFAVRVLLVLVALTLTQHFASAEVVSRGSIHFGPGEHTGRLNIQGNYLYFTLNSAELRILDISNPSQPVLVGQVQTRLGNESPAFYGTDVEVFGDYAYVNCGLNVAVVNIADKANPTVVTRFARPTQTMSLDLADGVLYVGDATSLGIYSLVIPAAPQHLGTYNAQAEVREVVVANRLAYLAAHSGGFMIVDVALPASPTRVARVPAAAAAAPIDLALNGNLAYVTTDYHLKIYDVTNPASPALLGETFLGVGFNAFRDAVTYANGYVYVHGFFQSYQVVDVRNPAQPQLVLNTNLPGYVENTGADILADGNHLYIANGSAGVRVFDISAPATPQPVGNYIITTSLQSIFLAGNRAYGANAAGEILVFNIADTANPQILTRVPTLYAPRFFVSAGDRFFSVFNGGFELYSLANPDLPSLLGRYNGPVTSIAGAGNYAFLSRPGNIDTLDISNPSAITTVATRAAAGDMNLKLGGAYLAASAVSVPTYVFDTSNPLALREIGTYPQQANSMDFDGNTLFTSNVNGTRALVITPNAVTPADSTTQQGLVGADAGRLWAPSDLFDARDLANLIPAGAGNAGFPVYSLDASGSLMALTHGNLFRLFEGTLPNLTPRPELEAIYNGSELTIRWPATFSDYKLYVIPSIGAQWELVSESLPQENGYFVYVNRFPTAPMRLYQLQKP